MTFVKERDADKKDLILIMRFNIVNPFRHARVYMSQTDIAKVLGESKELVHRICTSPLRLNGGNEMPQTNCRSKITQLHKAYLTGLNTLVNTSGYTLAERAVLFHRKFPEVTISSAYIGKIYK